MRLTRRTAIGGGLAAALAPPAVADAAGVPFRISPAGHVIAPVTLNGETVHGLIDNGFSVSAMDLGHARRRGVEGMQTMALNGAETRRSVRVDVGFGGVTTRMRPPMLDLSDIPTPDGKPVTLIIGRDVLAQVLLTLDFDVGRCAVLRVGERALDRVVEGVQGRMVRLSACAAGHAMEVVVEGRRLSAAVDLGAAMPLMVREGVQAEAWADGRRWSTSGRATARGAAMVVAERKVTRAKELVVAGCAMAHVPVEVFAVSDPVFGAVEAVVGAPVLARFLVSLDVAGARMWLKANAAAGARFASATVGARVRVEEDGLHVVHVAASSPAAHAGVQVGDVIASINGAPAKRDTLLHAKPADALSLALVDGTVHDVIAAEYY